MTSWQSLSTLSYLQLPSEMQHNSILSIPSHYLSISSFVSHAFLFHQLFLWSNCLGETRWAGDMPIQSQLPFLYWSEKFFIRANQCPDTTVDLFICDVVFVSDVKTPSLASHFYGLNSSLQFRCQCPCLASKQEDWDDKWMHKSHLCLERDGSFFPNQFQALKVQLLFVPFEPGASEQTAQLLLNPAATDLVCLCFSLSWIMGVSRAKRKLGGAHPYPSLLTTAKHHVSLWLALALNMWPFILFEFHPPWPLTSSWRHQPCDAILTSLLFYP